MLVHDFLPAMAEAALVKVQLLELARFSTLAVGAATAKAAPATMAETTKLPCMVMSCDVEEWFD